MDLVQTRRPLNTASAPPTPPASRQVHIPRLREECRRLLATFQEALRDDAKAALALAALRIQCEECGTRLTPSDLAALAATAAPSLSDSPRAARLNQGYCASAHCQSYYYRIDFPPTEGLDWHKALAAAAHPEPEAPSPDAAPKPKPPILAGLAPIAARIGAGLALILALLLVRQWYIGGTIPLLREPRRFEAAPMDPSFQASPKTPPPR